MGDLENTSLEARRSSQDASGLLRIDYGRLLLLSQGLTSGCVGQS
jgi:hypothetical protein